MTNVIENMKEEKSTLQEIADALGCGYGHVRNVVSGQNKSKTELNKQILTLYAAKKQEELEEINQQIQLFNHLATTDIEERNQVTYR